jgi:uncharacterized SAM-binding protein YcdF (DUF218 family)
MADVHLQSGLKQFASTWLDGVAAVLTTGLAKKIVIVGGLEQRYLPKQRIPRPEVIRLLLVRRRELAERLDKDPARIECVTSEPKTLGNAEAASDWLAKNDLWFDKSILVCAYWHTARASLDFLGRGLSMPVFPAEAVFLAGSPTSSVRKVNESRLLDELGRNDFAARVVAECGGIADKLRRVYRPLSEQKPPPRAA